MASCYDHAHNCCIEWCKECQRCETLDEAERAVIEAAKALDSYFVHLESVEIPYAVVKRMHALSNAVRALLAAEGGKDE